MVDDEIRSPRHYAGDGKIEAKHAMRSMMHGVHMPSYISSWWFAAFKYLWRWPHKNGLQDLYKARESLDELIRAAEAESWVAQYGDDVQQPYIRTYGMRM